MNRREFIKRAGIAAAGITTAGPLASTAAGAQAVGGKKKMRLAVVGTGVRFTYMYGKPVLDEYGDLVELVGICDINPGRLEYVKKKYDLDCPTFTADKFEDMIKQTKPDKIIVTVVDAYHDIYITKAMNLGCDVISEKPMTTDQFKCQRILDTEKRTGKNLIVTFNYRYSPHRQRIKELLMDNVIGKVTSVDFHWYLDTDHGASYFRRWHSIREKSGTLLVHKATHHFDLLNWWLDSDPVEVFAYGDLEYYGKAGPYRSKNCRGCPHKDKCLYYWDILGLDDSSKSKKELYADHESYDGYLRDSCVYRPEINIYDKMAVQLKYANNVQVSYSLTTYSPYEGYRIAFNGTHGRLESWVQEAQPWPRPENYEIRLSTNTPGDCKSRIIKVPHSTGGHGGGDKILKDRLFKDPHAPDPLSLAAGSRDGAMSILVGVAARESIESGRPVRIDELVEIEPQAVRPKKA